MKAIVLENFGNTNCLKLKEIPTPVPGSKEVRIKIQACGFNPIDFKIRKGMYGGPLPRILGSDCSGVIDAVGIDVKNLSIDDEVFAMTYGYCSNGSYAEYVCLPEELVVKKPKNLTFQEAAVIPLVSMTAYRAMLQSTALKEGDTIFIAGIGGGLGSLAVQLARFCKVGSIYTVASSKESANYIEDILGINPNKILIYNGLSVDDLLQKLIRMNKGRLFDATFDFVGGDMKRLCFQLTDYSGHIATVLPERDEVSFPILKTGHSLFFNRNLSLHTVNVVAESHSDNSNLLNIYKKQLSHISQLLEDRDLHPPPLKVIGNFSEETVMEAHQLLEQGRVKGKLAMQVSGSKIQKESAYV